MTVFIINYRGTMYGVYSSREKAMAAALMLFGANSVAFDECISEKEVK